MKKTFLFASLLCLGTLSVAQIYQNNFDQPIANANLTKTDFRVSQAASDLVIFSRGHGEWSTVTLDLLDNSVPANVSISKKDTIYVRAKAVFTGTVNPVMNIGLRDVNGVGPNNENYNAVNKMTLTNEYKIFKFLVPNWNQTWGASTDPNLGKDMDSTKISEIVFGPNTAFASFPALNGLGQNINASFNGTIYIDYVSFGAPGVSTTSLPIVNGFTEEFNAEVDIETPVSFVTSLKSGALSIVSEGHDEWEYVRLNLTQGKVDLTNNKILEFTASATKASGYNGPIGVMVVAVDETGERLEAPGTFKLQSLTSESRTIQVLLPQFKNAQGDSVVASRIAFLDILINTGFASAPQTNNLDESLSTAFQGEILISSIKLGNDVEPNGIVSTKKNYSSFGVYPNPATAEISIDNSFVGNNYSIFNSNGQEVQSSTLESNIINTSDLTNGLYILKIKNDNEILTTSFVKK